MDKQEIEKLKNKLLNTRQELNDALKTFAAKDPQLKGDWDTKYPNFRGKQDPNVDLEEEASEVEAYMTRLPIEHSYELRVQAINNALDRIEKGTYGLCVKCGKQIPSKRLEAYPEADKCLDCQKKL